MNIRSDVEDIRRISMHIRFLDHIHVEKNGTHKFSGD